MKTVVALIFLVASPGFVLGQLPASRSEVCTKNISIAVAEGGQPVPAIPKFILKWLASNSHQQHYSDLCFSQIPSASLNNYIVVFSTSEAAFAGLTPSAHTYTSTTPAPGSAAIVSSYGGTWSYAFTGVPPPATTATLDLKRDDKPKSLDVRAYDQRGRAISRHSLGGFPSREKLLEQVFADILGDSPLPLSRKPLQLPLSVYYVNCDVDGPPTPTAMGTPLSPPPEPANNDPAPRDPPVPSVLEIWSTPPGADIFLDNRYAGKTPYSLVVPPVQHTITLRKKDFGTWQRKVLVVGEKLRIAASLEQKVLTLEPLPEAASTERPRDDAPARTELAIWSKPPAADIFLDGGYVGKTPYTQIVPPGEHTITMHKKDFATWQRRVQATGGKLRVGAALAQKSPTLE